jgi:hypothetical protein
MINPNEKFLDNKYETYDHSSFNRPGNIKMILNTSEDSHKILNKIRNKIKFDHLMKEGEK